MNPRPRSATDGGTPVAAVAATAGERFARALAAKDSGALCALLADPLDFQALTPGRHWSASTGRQAVEEIILAWWFGAGDEITELCSVASGRCSTASTSPTGCACAGQAVTTWSSSRLYHNTEGPRITWMRVLALWSPAVPWVTSAAGGADESAISPWLAATGWPAPGWWCPSWRRCARHDGRSFCAR